VKKLQKSLKELAQVNPQAGYLRLFFLVILIFIFWSLLAIISTSFNPMGNLIFRKISSINSSNLAFSLFWDILKAYFSTFSISSLILFLSIFFISFETIADFYSKLISISSKRMSKNYLSNCAFSIPQICSYRFPDYFINSFKNKYSFPDGPLKAVLKPGYALFVRENGIYKTWINHKSSTDDSKLTLGHQDKIVDCFSISPATISIYSGDIVQSKFIKIELAYSYNLPVDHESIDQSKKMFELCDSKNMRSLIEKILVSEVKACIYQYSHNSSIPLPFFNSQSLVDKKSNNKKLVRDFGQKANFVFINFMRKFKKRVVKRNRKRPIYLSPGFSPDNDFKVKGEDSPLSLIDTLNDSFTTNLLKTMGILFGANIINAKIIKIYEQETK